MRAVNIVNRTRPLDSSLVADYCESFACKLRGLSFRLHLPAEKGLILVDKNEGRLDTAIHMLWMNFDISVVWLDKSLKVVDLRLAKRWRSFILPRKPAQYVIECGASRLAEFHLGHQIAFEDAL